MFHITFPLWRESTGDRWNPQKRSSNAKSIFMTWRHQGMDGCLVFLSPGGVHLHTCWVETACLGVDSLRPRRNGRQFPDDIFKCILLNENVWTSSNISLKFVPKGPINNYPELVQIMAWRRPGDKPFTEPMMIISLTHICATRPQWVKKLPMNQHPCGWRPCNN